MRRSSKLIRILLPKSRRVDILDERLTKAAPDLCIDLRYNRTALILNIHKHPHRHMSGGCCCVWRYRTTASFFLLTALLLARTPCETLPDFVPFLYCFCTRFLGLPKCPDTYRKQGQHLLPAGLLLLQFWLAIGRVNAQGRTGRQGQHLLPAGVVLP